MVLAALTSGAVEDAQRRERDRPMGILERAALERSPALNALDALAPGSQVKIIAEVKRASPSRGTLAAIPDPANQALLYQEGGASAVSVLTEERRFGGSLEDLESVTARVQIPVLRKDFIATRYQVLEARAAGADIVLLIVAGLEPHVLQDLYGFILELGMTPLVETHSAEELARAAELGAKLIGVNARDLRTLELDRDLFDRLSDRFPADAIKIAESAVRGPDDVARYRAAGADVVLIGEALVTGDPVATLRAFIAGAESGSEAVA